MSGTHLCSPNHIQAQQSGSSHFKHLQNISCAPSPRRPPLPHVCVPIVLSQDYPQTFFSPSSCFCFSKLKSSSPVKFHFLLSSFYFFSLASTFKVAILLPLDSLADLVTLPSSSLVHILDSFSIQYHATQHDVHAWRMYSVKIIFF